MARTVLAVVAGLFAWAVVASLLDLPIRALIPGYHAAEHTLAFTLDMKVARLTLAVLTSLAAGAVARLVAPGSRAAPWIIGCIVLALFLPEHIRIGNRLPLWYHVAFLATIVPLVVLGARAAAAGRAKGKTALV